VRRPRVPLAALFALLWGEWRAHPARTLVGIVAVAIGVAMGYAVQIINQVALNEFSQGVRSLMGDADLSLRGPQAGFDETLYARVATLPDVAVASPVVEVSAHVPGQAEALQVLGVDALRAATLTPALVGRTADADAGSALFDADTVFVSPAALAWLGARVGGSLSVQVGLETVHLRIAGTLPAAGEGVRTAVMDIGAAQWRLRRLGLLQRIDIKLRPGVDPQRFAQQAAAWLPPGVRADTRGDQRRRTSSLSRAYRVNLNVLALIALFTGAFLVFTMQALSVLRRRSQFALLRALGLTRRALLRMIVAEGAAQGVAGAAAGIALGYALAALVLRYAGGDLGGGYFAGVRPSVHFEPGTTALFFALGVGAAALGSFTPAFEAARAQPARALKAGDEEAPLERLRPPWAGLATLAAAGLALAGPSVGGLPIFGYIAIALMLIGAILLLPRVARTVFGWLPSFAGAVPQLATTQVALAPARATVGIAGIVTSFSLMAAMAIMVSSFRLAVEQWLDVVLPAQLYVRAAPAGDTASFPVRAQSLIATTPGVARVEFLRTSQISLDPGRPPVTLLVRPIDPASAAARLPLTGAPARLGADAAPPVWISEAMVDLYGMHPGQRIVLPLAGRQVTLSVAGVWQDYARQFGSVVIGQADWRRITGDTEVTDASLWLTPETGAAQVEARLRQRLGNADALSFAQSAEIRAVSLRIFDRSFAVTYLLEGVAVLIGLFGVGATFGAQALARSREFGMLRHIGLRRTQIGAMLVIEGGLVAVLGVALGLALGWAIAVVLVKVVNPQSFHWTMDMHFPWALLAGLSATVICAAAVSALASGRRAMSPDAVRAVREDW
jgi:putative ABC transport system permease protein